MQAKNLIGNNFNDEGQWLESINSEANKMKEIVECLFPAVDLSKTIQESPVLGSKRGVSIESEEKSPNAETA